LSKDDLKILREFRSSEVQRRNLVPLDIKRTAQVQVGTKQDETNVGENKSTKSKQTSELAPSPVRLSYAKERSVPSVLDREQELFNQFAKYASGAVAFQSSSKTFKLSRFGIEVKEEKIGAKLGLLSSEGNRAITMDLRECLEFCKSLGIVPAVPGPDNEQNVKIVKTDVSSIEYALVVDYFKSVENSERELDFDHFVSFLHKLFTEGINELRSKLESRLIERLALQQRMTKYLQSSHEPMESIRTIFSNIFDSVYDAFVFFDIEGSWQVSAPTFLHLCKNILELPLTNADLNLALESVGWLQSLNAHDFIHKLAWHPVNEKTWGMKREDHLISSSETELYKTFRFFCQQKGKDVVTMTSNSSDIQSFQSSANTGSSHMSFQQYVEFLKFVGIVPTHIVRNITGESTVKTDVGSPEYEIAVKVFRQTIDRQDLMGWVEFKDCLFYTIRGPCVIFFAISKIWQ
jgi:hypothetical protein